MKPTIRGMAGALGLSPSTISKALSGKPEINEATRQRVVSYAKEAGYFKNASPRGRLAMLVANPSEIDNSSILFHLLMGFQKYAEGLQKESVIINVNLADMHKQKMDDLIFKNQLDGMFVAGLKTTDPYYHQLDYAQGPIAVLDIQCNSPTVGTIGTNSILGGHMAIAHLCELGHRRIGFINGHKEAYISQERLAGYVAALNAHDIDFDPRLCYNGDFSRESGHRAAEYFFDKKITAIYAASDIMALGAMQWLNSVGLSVPMDMSIVGFDNQPMCLGANPPLTTVAQDPVALGEAACALLHSLLSVSPIRHVLLSPKLIIRETTKNAP